MGHAALIAEHGNKQVGDAGLAHFAKRGELLAFDTIEQQDAPPEHLALVNRLQRPCCGDLLGIHHHFQIARLEFFHAAIEYDAAAVDEHDIGEHVLDLFHLVCRHHDSAVAIEIVAVRGDVLVDVPPDERQLLGADDVVGRRGTLLGDLVEIRPRM